MQKFLSTINDVKKINKAKKMISDESKKNIINTNEEKYEDEYNYDDLKVGKNHELILIIDEIASYLNHFESSTVREKK